MRHVGRECHVLLTSKTHERDKALYYASVKFGQRRELVHQHMIVEGLHDR